MIPEEISRSITKAESVALFTHLHPDGDALGSLLGFAEILEALGKKVFCYLDEPVPYLYNFLPGCDRVSSSLEELERFRHGAKNVVAISLDCGDSDRLGVNKEIFLQIEPFLVIDHHLSHREFGNYRWVEPGRSSTGEMVFELAELLGAELSYTTAYNLFVAISTDTGSFKYDSTSAKTLRVAADLIDLGVKPDEISGRIYNNYTLERLRLMEMVLSTLEIHNSGEIAIIRVSQEMFAQANAMPEDIEGFIDFPRSITSVKVAAFIKEGEKGLVSVSLRAKGDCDVAEIAKSFGGGGHRNAAGFRFRGKTVEQVTKIVISTLGEAVSCSM